MMVDACGMVLLTVGVAFTVIGHVGLVRLPDFYTRAHAASKPDTMGVVLVMLGLAVREGVSTVAGLKLVLVAIFVAIANPVAVHVISRSALRSGCIPWRRG